MSENRLRLIPTDPGWVPPSEAAERAAAILARIAPGASNISHRVFDSVTFIDCGGNFECIGCPACGRELSTAWWQDQMGRAFSVDFADLAILTPCCKTEMSLNDLDYRWPIGFARWELVASSPRREQLDDREIEALETAVGHAVREIWTHI